MPLPVYLCLTKAEYVVWVHAMAPDLDPNVIAHSWALLPYPFIWSEGEPLVIIPV